MLDGVNLFLDSPSSFALPHLQELSLSEPTVSLDARSTNGPNPHFLSRDRFPSLRALALHRYRGLLEGQPGVLPLPIDLLAQLETFVTGELDGTPLARSFVQSPIPIPIPFLLDLDFSEGLGRHSLPSGPLRREYIRIRLPRDPMHPDRGERGEIEAALSLVVDLVNTTQELKAIYLDFGIERDEKDDLDEELRKRFEHSADPTRNRKVENCVGGQ